jgi:ribosome-associated protein
MADPIEIPITGETIRLGQLLKLAGVVDSGAQARTLLASAEVLVNGERDARRGRQLRAGDEVRVGGHELRVTADARARGAPT